MKLMNILDDSEYLTEKTKSYQHGIVCEQLQSKIRSDEFIKFQNILNEISYAKPSMIKALYTDKYTDEVDYMDVKADSVIDYHNSKTSMLCNSKPAL